MGILDIPGLPKATADGLYTGQAANNVGTRIFTGAVVTIDNSAANTYHVTCEVAQQFDAVRLVLVNNSTNSQTILAAAVSSPASAADLNNSSGTWLTAPVRQTIATFPTKSAFGAQRPTYTVTDWVALPSTARSDSGTQPMIAARVWVGANASLPAYGYSTDDYTNWASRTDGRLWCSRQQSGNQVSTPTGFTSTTNTSNSPIVGVQYLARGRVVTVAAVGDSITSGRGTYLNDGFVPQACAALSSMSGTAIECANLGWPGQVGAIYWERAVDLMESELRPDVLVLPSGSPNDISSTIGATDIQTFARERGEFLHSAHRNRVTPALWTWLPSNTAVKAYGTSDSLRVADNAQVLAEPSLLVADTSTAISGTTSGGQVQMAASLTTDGIHPNDLGNTTLRDIVKPIIKKATARAGAGHPNGETTRAQLPSFLPLVQSVTLGIPGIYTWGLTTAATWTLGGVSGASVDKRLPGAQRFIVTARGNAGQITLTSGQGDNFLIGAHANASIIIPPGATVDITHDGFYWIPKFTRSGPYVKQGTLSRSLLRRTGAIAETYPRLGATTTAGAALATGKMTFVAIDLTEGEVISKITFLAGSTAAVTPTNQWFGLWDSAGNKLALTADDTTTAWNASSEKQLTLTAPYTVPADGLYYLSCMVAAATVPTLISVSAAGTLLAPLMVGQDTTHTALTNPASAPSVATISAVLTTQPWAWVA